MTTLYPASPTQAPAELTSPTPRYRRQTWLALGALLLFVLLYLGLTVWLINIAHKLFLNALSGHNELISMIGASLACLLAIFMIKGLIFFKRNKKADLLEITASSQPRLFEFLTRLAEEAGAPRPHKVFVTARVNAAVFYDLSVINLIFPSRKNLEIGLGLINVLNLSEFKAVCAHEFGHFAQRSMAVGRWVYIAEQIAAEIIARRDWLDHLVKGISRVDIRIAWVGWLASLMIWALRSVLHTLFLGVALAERALSREMELQADRMVVSLTGSDAILHALHRTQAADEAWDMSLQYFNGLLAQGMAPHDIFAVQSCIIESLRQLLNDANYGQSPQTDRETRIFHPSIARPPAMWATHPFNNEREDNARAHYIACERDERSVWDLFDQAEALRAQLTHAMYSAKDIRVLDAEQSLEEVRSFFKRKPFTRGLNPFVTPALGALYKTRDTADANALRNYYRNRSIVRHLASAQLPYETVADPIRALDDLYPAALLEKLDSLAAVVKERDELQALITLTGSARNRSTHFRGQTLAQKDWENTLETLRAEVRALEAPVHAHDLHCRSVHHVLAETNSAEWAAALSSHFALLHYAEHVCADLRDTHRHMHGVVQVVLRKRKVEREDVVRVVKAATQVYSTLHKIFGERASVTLASDAQALFEREQWSDVLGTLELGMPSENNINDWLRAVDSWVEHTVNRLDLLAQIALATLLECEGQLATAARAEQLAEAPPAAAGVPDTYPTLLPGAERKVSPKQGWLETIQSSLGHLMQFGRFGVAAAMLGSLFFLAGMAYEQSIVIYNGLNRNVVVDAGSARTVVGPRRSASLALDAYHGQQIHLRARTEDGTLIEAFDPDFGDGHSTRIYNVAAASPLVMWEQQYGNTDLRQRPAGSELDSFPSYLGAKRWQLVSRVDYLFTDPPARITTSSNVGVVSRSVLSAAPPAEIPEHLLNLFSENDPSRQDLILAHARWDPADAADIITWLAMASRYNDFGKIIQARLQENPHDIAAARAEQDATTDPAAHARLCAQHRTQADAHPDDPDFAYLALRCLTDIDKKFSAWQAANARWPTHPWIANAAAYEYAEARDWRKALDLWKSARRFAPLVAGINENQARVRRLASGNQVDLGDIINGPSSVSDELNLEAEHKETEDMRGAYVALGAGHLQRTIEIASKLPGSEPVMQLAACSDGASKVLVRNTLDSINEKSLQPAAMTCLLALATRTGHPKATTLRTQLKARMPAEIASQYERFIDLAQAGRLPEAEHALDHLDPYALGVAWSMGSVLLGPQAPPAWRENAHRLLFLSERPWFKLAS